MKNIIYEIEFYSNWHCGSGLAAGADVDVLVIKDVNGMPYVPGRTIKGLLREAAESLSEKEIVAMVFGVSGDQDNHKVGEAFFGNATLTTAEYQYITEQKLTKTASTSQVVVKIQRNIHKTQAVCLLYTV